MPRAPTPPPPNDSALPLRLASPSADRPAGASTGAVEVPLVLRVELPAEVLQQLAAEAARQAVAAERAAIASELAELRAAIAAAGAGKAEAAPSATTAGHLSRQQLAERLGISISGFDRLNSSG